ncbi:MAG: LexA family transcriptional regulator [Clostridia bacterium]|nr:LexA family transcriptional regulator [Clostridia bacterium]
MASKKPEGDSDEKGIDRVIGAKIKNLRLQLGWSPETLAKKLGKSTSAIRMWEGSFSQPDSSTYVKLARLFHVSTDYLLSTEDIHSDRGKYLPVYDELPKGIPIDELGTPVKIEELRPSMDQMGDFIGLRITNMNYEPYFIKDDVLIFHKQDEFSNGDIVAVYINDDLPVHMRYVAKDRKVTWLVPLNETVEESGLLITKEDIEEGRVVFVGRLAELRREY